MSKEILTKKKEDLPVELESQMILRLPQAASGELRKLLRGGSNSIKERLTVQLENDMRHGIVRFDSWVWPAKLVDLPCILETHKTIDRKTFYKTADISQMLVCGVDDDSQTPEEEDLTKKKDKKEIIKAEKKYQWPHGITPPLKNVRKRRFRKTLKKKVEKYIDAPEIEKEVKRLFRVDNEAVNVRWEVITDEDDGKSKLLMGESINSSVASPAISGPLFSNSQSLDIGEHDIFGEVVSSSEEEAVNIVDSGDEEASQLSSGNIEMKSELSVEEELVTQFSKRMLQVPSTSSPSTSRSKKEPYYGSVEDHIQAAMNDAGIIKKEIKTERSDGGLTEKLYELRQQLMDIRSRRQQHEQEIAGLENQALKQRFQGTLDSLIEEEKEKQRQYDDISAMLQHR